jgi:multisubunit Na+/H+ antiporter MnhB subunit
MGMIYRILADLVVVVHFAYVLGVILGLVAILMGWLLNWEWVRNRWFRGIHLAMILVVVVQAWLGVMCPLTIWEQQLRAKAGQQTYQGDFIANWVHDTLFIQAEPWVFTLCYSIFGGLVLATLLLVRPRWRRPRDTDAN